MAQISLLVRIAATPDEIYKYLSTPDGIAKWFTKASFSKNKDSGELNLQLWDNTNFSVTEISTRQELVWHCTSEDDEWFGTDIKFQLRPDSDKTIVIFDHSGWLEVSDFYRDCAMSWAYFLESLRSLIEDGVGTPEEEATECGATANN